MDTLEKDYIEIISGAWYQDQTVRIKTPSGTEIKYYPPMDLPGLNDGAVVRAMAEVKDDPSFRSALIGKKSACIVIDDITRPTPVRVPLEILVESLSGQIPLSAITVLIATGAHKPMSEAEMRLKVGDKIFGMLKILNHDFMGPDIRSIGRISGGPVLLNRHFLNADLRITLGGILPHNETGFGGGSKLIVPGIAGVNTITYFHGAIAARKLGLEAQGVDPDRRTWSEEVAREVGVNLSILLLINSRREIVKIVSGDICEAHLEASALCREWYTTLISPTEMEQADLCVINTYPLDTDPVQMGKALLWVKEHFKKRVLVINPASDGIFYHGMGMGCGIHKSRLLGNAWKFFHPRFAGMYLRSAIRILVHPALLARFTYFFLNSMKYRRYRPIRLEKDPLPKPSETDMMIVFSEKIPLKRLTRKYPDARLIRSKGQLESYLSEVAKPRRIIVLPCAPMQIMQFLSRNPDNRNE